MSSKSSYRIMLNAALRTGEKMLLTQEDANYMRNVLRCKIGHHIRVFNTQDGEFDAEVAESSKARVVITLHNKTLEPITLPKLHLALAIIKPEKFIDAIDMATQLGVTDIQPIICARSNYQTIKEDKILKRMQAATEQSERFAMPRLHQAIEFETYIKNTNTPILFANEDIAGQNTQWPHLVNATCLIGPEGGFSDNEISLMNEQSNCHPISLGQTILRSETAVAAMLGHIQLSRNS